MMADMCEDNANIANVCNTEENIINIKWLFFKYTSFQVMFKRERGPLNIQIRNEIIPYKHSGISREILSAISNKGAGICN